MALFSAKAAGLLIIAVTAVYAYLRKEWQLLTLLGFGLLAIGFADFTAYNIAKPIFGRIRPCHLAPDIVRAVYGCGGKYSFPSNHATNLAVCVFFVWRYYGRSIGSTVFLIAAIVGLSRIYLGVHYPLDIIAGYMYGLLIAIMVYRFGCWFMRFYFPGNFITRYIVIDNVDITAEPRPMNRNIVSRRG